jgi:hypothetical protein
MDSEEYAGTARVFLLSEKKISHKQNTIYEMVAGMDILWAYALHTE